MARRIITAVLIGYVVNTLIAVWDSDLGGIALLGFVACVAVALVVQVAQSTLDARSWSAWQRVLSLSVQAAVTFGPFLWVGPQAGSISGFLAGSTLLMIGGRVRWPVFVGVNVALLLALLPFHLVPSDVFYSIYFTALTGLMVYGVSSLASVAEEVHAARGDLARMAVVAERLRLSRDLHDLLGFSVSAMMLKSELAYRLLPEAADRARQEVQDVLDVARRALADVRQVSGGYGAMSLADEGDSVESMLTAAEIAVRSEGLDTEMGPELQTVLAIVLREAVTNILRHSKAQLVQIQVWQEDAQMFLKVSNDGVDGSTGSVRLTNGSGLENLAQRLRGAGGGLDVLTRGELFTVTASVALHPPVGAAAEPLSPRAVPVQLPREAPQWHVRIARLIVAVVCTGYGGLLLINVLPSDPGAIGAGALILGVLCSVGLQITMSLGRLPQWPGWLRTASVLTQAAAAFVPLIWITQPWGSMGGFVAGSVLLLGFGPWRWAGFVAVAAVPAAVAATQDSRPEWLAYLTISTVVTGLVLYGLGLLAQMLAQIENYRRELARLAVAQSRLRVAQELNAGLGRDLSAMSVKSELAYRLLPRSPDRARTEMAQVLGCARRAVANVRAAASGYRNTSLAAELDLNAPALRAAGIEMRTDLRVTMLPEVIEAVLSMILREALAHLLRDKGAKHCTVDLALVGGDMQENDGCRVQMAVMHDGAGAHVLASALASDTLTDLAERVEAVGGTFVSSIEDDWHEVVATLPMNTIGSPGPGPA